MQKVPAFASWQRLGQTHKLGAWPSMLSLPRGWRWPEDLGHLLLPSEACKQGIGSEGEQPGLNHHCDVGCWLHRRGLNHNAAMIDLRSCNLSNMTHIASGVGETWSKLSLLHSLLMPQG